MTIWEQTNIIHKLLHRFLHLSHIEIINVNKVSYYKFWEVIHRKCWENLTFVHLLLYNYLSFSLPPELLYKWNADDIIYSKRDIRMSLHNYIQPTACPIIKHDVLVYLCLKFIYVTAKPIDPHWKMNFWLESSLPTFSSRLQAISKAWSPCSQAMCVRCNKICSPLCVGDREK